MKKYYISDNDEQKGPFSLDELKQFKISPNSLIWSDDLMDWTEAESIEGVKELVQIFPPPLPKQADKIYRVEAEITKKKKNFLKDGTKVVAAKEIKTNFRIIFVAALVGILSLFVFYFGIYNVPKYDRFDYSKIHTEKRGGMTITSGVPGELGEGEFFSVNGDNKSIVKRRIEIRKKNLTNKSISSALLTFFMSSILFISIRYIQKGINWVNETSQKKV